MNRAIIATLALAAAGVSWAQPPETACVYLQAIYRFDRTLNSWVWNENRATNRWQGTLRLGTVDTVGSHGQGRHWAYQTEQATTPAGGVRGYVFYTKQSCPKVQTDGFMCAEKFDLTHSSNEGGQQENRQEYFDFDVNEWQERGSVALCEDKLAENPDLWNDYDHYELTCGYCLNPSETQLDCKYRVWNDDDHRWSWQSVGGVFWHNMASYEFVGGPSPDGADGVLVYNGDIDKVGRLSPRETCPSLGEPAHNGD